MSSPASRDLDGSPGRLRGGRLPDRGDVPALAGQGVRAERFADLIYRSGNGVAVVDDLWFEHAVEAELLGIPVRLCPAEEIIWSKSYVQERERFDGADIAHLIRRSGRNFDWKRLIRRFGDDWRVLLGHLVNFGFVYPGERDVVPDVGDARAGGPPGARGRRAATPGKGLPGDPAVARAVPGRHRRLGLRGCAARTPRGAMTAEQITHWTAAIGHHSGAGSRSGRAGRPPS